MSYDVEFLKNRRLIIIEEHGISPDKYLGCEISLEEKPCFVSGHYQRKNWLYMTLEGQEVRLCEKCHRMVWNFLTT